MEIKLLVEGETDAKFFEELSLKVLPYKFSRNEKSIIPYEGKDNLKSVLEDYIRLGTGNILVTRDIDDKTPEEVEQIVKQYLASISKVQKDTEEGYIVKQSRVIFIPIGLYNDEDLKDLGISNHSVEDYLIKLALRQSSQLRETFSQLLNPIKQKGFSFPRSKELFQLIKPFSELPPNDEGAIAKVLANATAEDVKQICGSIIKKVTAFKV